MIKYDFRKSTKCTYFETEGVQNKMCTGILGTPTYCMQSYTQDYGDLYKENIVIYIKKNIERILYDLSFCHGSPIRKRVGDPIWEESFL